MRIDVLLNKLCIVKARNIAKKACDNGAIIVNGKIAKPGTEIYITDIIDCNLYGYRTKIKIIKIPEGNVAKKDVLDYYRIEEKEKVIES